MRDGWFGRSVVATLSKLGLVNPIVDQLKGTQGVRRVGRVGIVDQAFALEIDLNISGNRCRHGVRLPGDGMREGEGPV